MASARTSGVNASIYGLERYDPRGRRDEAFLARSRLPSYFGDDPDARYAYAARSIVTTGSGGFVTAGAYIPRRNALNPTFEVRFGATRHLRDGSVDPSFGTSGVVEVCFPAAGSDDPVAAADVVDDDPNGRIVMAGGFSPSIAAASTRSTIAVARLNPDGSLDPSFSGDGRVVLQVPGAREVVGVPGTHVSLTVSRDVAVMADGSHCLGRDGTHDLDRRRAFRCAFAGGRVAGSRLRR